ncbi:MAG TPA: NAD(+) diphosphatase [Geothrix sp.]|nr:NAD(+) diphosphatase [Geothrix sp.]
MHEGPITFQGDRLWLPLGSVPAGAQAHLSLPEGVTVLRAEADEPLPAGVEALGLRDAYPRMNPEDWLRAGRAYQWLEWEAGHRFCGHCALALVPAEGHGRRCPSCGRSVFPGNSTAIIVLIQRGRGPEREWALARSPHFKPGVYSSVAGFTEPGESLEAAVHREVDEELGIRIHNLRYFGSQPWPFPNGLMVGFRAEYLEGDLTPDPSELEDARWFSRENLPDLPSAISIARWMMDAALAETD